MGAPFHRGQGEAEPPIKLYSILHVFSIDFAPKPLMVCQEEKRSNFRICLPLNLKSNSNPVVTLTLTRNGY